MSDLRQQHCNVTDNKPMDRRVKRQSPRCRIRTAWHGETQHIRRQITIRFNVLSPVHAITPNLCGGVTTTAPPSPSSASYDSLLQTAPHLAVASGSLNKSW